MPDLVQANKRRTALLAASVTFVIALVGALIGALAGPVLVGTAVGAILGAALVVAAYFTADRIALSVSRARPADPDQYRRLHNLVEGLCLAAGLPAPRIYVIDDAAPNSFATGRSPKYSSIAVTTGLLEQMDRVELEGLVAHELSHIRHYDTLVGTTAVATVGGITLLGDLLMRLKWWNGGRVPRHGDAPESSNPVAYLGFAAYVVAPLTGPLMRGIVPSSRETLADVSACQMTRYPPGLISALEKLNDDTTVTHSATTGTAHLWIAQPMSGVGDHGRLGTMHRKFVTHPTLDERIALLREL
jgi:heat shock protein HtpX